MQLKRDVQLIQTDLYADGIQHGLLKKFDTFETEFKARAAERKLAEAERDEDIKFRHSQNQWRLNAIIALLGVLVTMAFELLKKGV